jgi:hypothetical protein
MGRLPFIFLKVPDLPPGRRFPQASAAWRGAARDLVMTAARNSLGGATELQHSP